MYRKLSLVLATVNIVVFFSVFWVILPWILEPFQYVNVEMSAPVLWLIKVSHVVANPYGAVLLLALCFFGVKAIDRWAAQ